MDKLNDFINRVNIVVAKSRVAEKERFGRGELFNIFEVCGINHYELSHSKIIAELLNPSGTHGQGTLFLKAFLDIINRNSNIIIKFDLVDVVVETEKVIDSGRVDIIIFNSKRQAVIIENKIYAYDQKDQLKRYAKYAEDIYREFHILYLSLDGHESSEAKEDCVEYIPISYSIEIIDWLTNCKQLAIDKPLIRETLSQYVYHIKKLTKTDYNMDEKLKEELLDLLINNKDVTKQIFQSEKDIKEKLIKDYIFPDLAKLADELDCEFGEDLGSKSKYGGFWFASKLSSCTIRFEFQSGGNYTNLKNLIGGLPEVYNKQIGSTNKLKCFANATEAWPLGYNWLDDKYSVWDLDTLFYVKDNIEEFRNYIKEFITDIFNALR